MPIHDWTRVPSGLFHDFHQTWSVQIKTALNRGLLPKGLSAMVEQRSGPKEGDVLTIESRSRSPNEDTAGVWTLERPITKIVRQTTKEIYSGRANRVVVRHHLGRIVAVIEIVSPGNKESRAGIRDFVDKTIDFLRQGIHMLILDLFPPTPRDPYGIHKLIWDEIDEEEFHFPDGKDRILVAYETNQVRIAYVEPVTVGDILPDMPLFLQNSVHIQVPLESTYQAAWESCGEEFHQAVETGIMPNENVGE